MVLGAKCLAIVSQSKSYLLLPYLMVQSLFPILDLFIGVFGTYIAEKYVNLHLY